MSSIHDSAKKKKFCFVPSNIYFLKILLVLQRIFIFKARKNGIPLYASDNSTKINFKLDQIENKRQKNE